MWEGLGVTSQSASPELGAMGNGWGTGCHGVFIKLLPSIIKMKCFIELL